MKFYSEHPKGLLYLFTSELWERFAFYGLRALLVLYMTQKLIMTDRNAFGIFAAYMSLAYVTPLFGGIIADKIIGLRRAIILGGILMSIGYFLLIIQTPFFFYTALAIITVGIGFFKPNMSSLTGSLYSVHDKKRESAFTIFYLGINVGGALGPLICAWLAISYGWQYGFFVAGITMLIGLLMFLRGLKKGVFQDKGKIPQKSVFNQKRFGIKQGVLVNIFSLLVVPILGLVIVFHHYQKYLVAIVFFLIVAIMFLLSRKITKPEKKRLGAVFYFVISAVVFWTLFYQIGSSLTIFAHKHVNLIGINAAQTNSINAGFIMLLALPFSWLWTYLNKTKKNPNAAVKFSIGIISLGIGFLIMGMSGHFADTNANVPMIFVFVGYFFLTTGELFVSPIGLSKMEALSPAKMTTFIIGVWFSASFFGHFFAGKMAQLITRVRPREADSIFNTFLEFVTGISHTDFANQHFRNLYRFVSVFAASGLIVILIGILAFCISPRIKKLMK
ncbi:peptide MFS transporter [Aureivirga sp. CE67]|uniref:peptide MFS transporter n=1 Tax=Aureivirga sp. CE67 TaxID=1788983 RepID=UPI0018CB2805|nr:peptide MFS transporter [Aureivirga sp. CE67]